MPSPEHKRHKKSKKRILIVDDNKLNRFVLANAVKLQLGVEEGEIEYAENGKQAVKAFKELHPELVLLDCQMPEMRGDVAALEMRKAEEHTHDHAIIFSFTCEIEYCQMGAAGYKTFTPFKGADAALSKPLITQEFKELLIKFNFIKSDLKIEKSEEKNQESRSLPASPPKSPRSPKSPLTLLRNSFLSPKMQKREPSPEQNNIENENSFTRK